jgi:hypothetical protein
MRRPVVEPVKPLVPAWCFAIESPVSRVCCDAMRFRRAYGARNRTPAARGVDLAASTTLASRLTARVCGMGNMIAAALTVGDVLSDTLVGLCLDTWAFGPDPPLPPPAS